MVQFTKNMNIFPGDIFLNLTQSGYVADKVTIF